MFLTRPTQSLRKPVPADYDGPVYELSEHGELVAPKENDVVLIDMDPIVTRSPREISNNIDMATTEFELDALEKEINALTDGPKKRELKEKLNQKRNEMNYSNIDEYNQTYEANNEPYYDPANDPANWGMLDDFNNDFGDDFGGLF